MNIFQVKKKNNRKSDYNLPLLTIFSCLPSHLGQQPPSLPWPTGAAWSALTIDLPGASPTVLTTHSTGHTPLLLAVQPVQWAQSHLMAVELAASFTGILFSQKFTWFNSSFKCHLPWSSYLTVKPSTPPNTQQTPFLLISLHSVLPPLTHYVFWFFLPSLISRTPTLWILGILHLEFTSLSSIPRRAPGM